MSSGANSADDLCNEWEQLKELAGNSDLCQKIEEALQSWGAEKEHLLTALKEHLLTALNDAAEQLSEWSDVAKLITEGFVPAAKTLKEAEWSDNDVAKLITEGFVPAANALKGAGWNADEVAKLITEGFVPAAKTLGEKELSKEEKAALEESFPSVQWVSERNRKWKAGEIAQFILHEDKDGNKHGLAPAIQGLNRWNNVEQITELIKEGFVHVARVLKPIHGWSAARIATLVSRLGNINQWDENKKDELVTLLQDGIVPAAIVIGPKSAARKLQGVCPDNPANFYNCIPSLLQAVRDDVKPEDGEQIQKLSVTANSYHPSRATCSTWPSFC